MLSTMMACGLSAADSGGLDVSADVACFSARTSSMLALHGTMARSAQQKCPAGFGVAARPVGDDVIGLAGDLRQFVEDLVGAAKTDGLDLGHGFA